MQKIISRENLFELNSLFLKLKIFLCNTIEKSNKMVNSAIQEVTAAKIKCITYYFVFQGAN